MDNIINKLLAVGDSFTYGSEIINPSLKNTVTEFDYINHEYRISNIWPTLLSKKLQFTECINLGWPGASNDRSVRVLINYLIKEYFSKDKVPNDIFIIIGLTSPERKDFFYYDNNDDNKFWFTLWPNWQHKYEYGVINKFSKLYESNFWNFEEYINRYVNQLLFLQLFFEKYNIPYLMFQSFYLHNTRIKNWIYNTNDIYYNYGLDEYIWNMICPIHFMNKNEDKNTFYHYLEDMDTSDDKSIFFKKYHPSEIGHNLWAEYLYEYINKHKIINT